jgi:hypothetical protein
MKDFVDLKTKYPFSFDSKSSLDFENLSYGILSFY